jgi:hypothetical protein
MYSSGHAGVIAQSPEPLLRVEVEVLDSTNKPPLASAHNKLFCRQVGNNPHNDIPIPGFTKLSEINSFRIAVSMLDFILLKG